jgi:hypothetical protein
VVDGEAKVFDHPISSTRVFFSTIKRPEKDQLLRFTLHRDVPRLESYPLYSCAGICQDLMVDSGSLPSRSSISSLASGNLYLAFCFDCRGSWLVLLAAESGCLVPFLQVLVNEKPAVTSSQTIIEVTIPLLFVISNHIGDSFQSESQHVCGHSSALGKGPCISPLAIPFTALVWLLV